MFQSLRAPVIQTIQTIQKIQEMQNKLMLCLYLSDFL